MRQLNTLRPKIIRRLLTINRHPWGGFLLTLVATVIFLYLRIYVNFSLSSTFFFTVLSVYMGGLWWGLASAGIVIAAEVFLLFPTGQYGRFTTISLTLIGTVYLVAILQREAILYETINGNIKTLLKIMVELQDLLEDWNRLPRGEIYNRLKKTTNEIVDLSTQVKGWHDLKMEMNDTSRAMMDNKIHQVDD